MRRVCANILPYLTDLFVGEHTFPRRHLALAVAHRVVEACAIVLRQPAQIESLAGADQSLAVADLAIIVVDVFSGIDLSSVLGRRRHHERKREARRDHGANAGRPLTEFFFRIGVRDPAHPGRSPTCGKATMIAENGGESGQRWPLRTQLTCRTVRRSTAIHPWGCLRDLDRPP